MMCSARSSISPPPQWREIAEYPRSRRRDACPSHGDVAVPAGLYRLRFLGHPIEPYAATAAFKLLLAELGWREEAVALDQL